MENIVIVDFKAEFAADFSNINREWIASDFYQQHFYIEDYDIEVLSNPSKHIVAKGGHILFAKLDNKIVGTVALISREADTFELSKLAVLQDYRGFNISDKLMAAAIQYSQRVGKKAIWLESIKKLKPALTLFEKFGFKEIPLDEKPHYAKADIKMMLELDTRILD